MMMKHRNRWLMALLVAALAVLLNWQGKDVTVFQQGHDRPAASVVIPQDDRHHEATLTDATSLYRVCSSRPQRIVPSHCSKTERNYSPCGFARYQFVKPLNTLYDTRRRLETAPFCLSASCHYYVIALRHIIR